MRSRTNSLRNGETSRVIENLDIEQTKLDKEQIEEYLRFKALKTQQSNTNDVAPRDRKLSQEYFKEEARRLDQKLKQACHQNKQTTLASVDETEQKVELQKKMIIPNKKFTCFKVKSSLLKQDTVTSAFGLYDKIKAEED